MARDFAVGDAVQTPMGKGVVREVRNNGRLLVLVQSRQVVIAARDVTAATPSRRQVSPQSPPAGPIASAREAPVEVDLHGLTVDEALTRIDAALDAALRAGHAELRFIHGKSGGRLRGALQQRLRGIAAVRGQRLDPRNAGVTIVSF